MILHFVYSMKQKRLQRDKSDILRIVLLPVTFSVKLISESLNHETIFKLHYGNFHIHWYWSLSELHVRD
jgi:hypothetical protein